MEIKLAELSVEMSDWITKNDQKSVDFGFVARSGCQQVEYSCDDSLVSSKNEELLRPSLLEKITFTISTNGKGEPATLSSFELSQYSILKLVFNITDKEVFYVHLHIDSLNQEQIEGIKTGRTYFINVEN